MLELFGHCFCAAYKINSANLNDIEAVGGEIFGYLPTVLVASIITLICCMVADVVRVYAMLSLTNFGEDYAKMLAGVLFGFIIVLGLTARRWIFLRPRA